MRESVCIETSVVSYLVARPATATISEQWQCWTVDWWRLRRPLFDCMISGEVLREAAAGDSTMAAKRLEALSSLHVLARAKPVEEIANAFLSQGLLPAKAKADAIHLAFASVYEADYLLTWNMKHLANAILNTRLKKVAQVHGWHFPSICTPIQLMGQIEYEG
jgi:hypothetical protein